MTGYNKNTVYVVRGCRGTLREQARHWNIDMHIVRKRIEQLGWSVEDAVVTRPGKERRSVVCNQLQRS